MYAKSKWSGARARGGGGGGGRQRPGSGRGCECREFGRESKGEVMVACLLEVPPGQVAAAEAVAALRLEAAGQPLCHARLRHSWQELVLRDQDPPALGCSLRTSPVLTTVCVRPEWRQQGMLVPVWKVILQETPLAKALTFARSACERLYH